MCRVRFDETNESYEQSWHLKGFEISALILLRSKTHVDVTEANKRNQLKARAGVIHYS